MTREQRSAQAAGIAGYCFLFGCGGIVLIVGLAQLFGQFRHVMPEVRAMILATLTPQFAAGMFFMAFLVCVGAFLFWLDRHAREAA